MPLNPLAHFIITGVIQTFKAKHKMASLYTINHIIWQLEDTPESNAHLSLLPSLTPQSLIYSWRTVAQKGEATCPRAHSAVGQTRALEFEFRSPSLGVLLLYGKKGVSMWMNMNSP